MAHRTAQWAHKLENWKRLKELSSLIPGAITAAAQWGSTYGLSTFLSINPSLQEQYGRFALAVGFLSAVTSDALFRRFKTHTPVWAAVFIILTLVTIAPFIAANSRVSFGLPAVYFQILSDFAYIILHMATGAWIGLIVALLWERG